MGAPTATGTARRDSGADETPHVPSVSVIIPAYNRARWLPETVESVLNQTCRPLEVIIVDDGSTDDTEAVCARFPEPVRYLKQANAGVAAARNFGVRHSRGDWIAFGDSDDVWEPTKLAAQLAALEAHPEARWSVTDCTVIDLEGNPLPEPQGFTRVFPVFGELGVAPEELFAKFLRRGSTDTSPKRHVIYSGDAFALLFHGNVCLPSSVLMRRSLVDAVGGFDERFRVAEETEYCHRLAFVSPVVVVMSPLVKYRVGHAGSLISASNMTQLVTNALQSLDRASERATERRGTLSEVERVAYGSGQRRLLFHLAYSQLSVFDVRAARATVVRAWRVRAFAGPRSVAVYAASFLPVPFLRGLHGLKQRLRRLRG